ncbi:MAG: 50S ribosomal protein L17 [Candidatus Saccharimonadales bacterium]
MHRHGYQGTKFHRERDQRRALIKGLADSLIKYQSIETTLPKAKVVVPYVEKLITKAKTGDLANRRQIIAKLQTIESAHKLVDELAPKMTARSSGHLRIEKTGNRRGDNAPLARVSFVDDLNQAPVSKSVNETAASSKQAHSAEVTSATKAGQVASNEKESSAKLSTKSNGVKK